MDGAFSAHHRNVQNRSLRGQILRGWVLRCHAAHGQDS
jgi:hypothetical protein